MKDFSFRYEGADKRKSRFISKTTKFHSGKYDYSKVQYVNNHTDVIIVCPLHGEFKQKPVVHIRGGCSMCGREKTINGKSISYNQLIKRMNNTYGGSHKIISQEHDYKNLSSRIKVKCVIHGVFQTTGKKLLHKKRGCPKCRIEKYGYTSVKSTFSQFMLKAKKVHGEKYCYDSAEGVYKNATTKIPITCTLHGIFYQTPDMHANRGSGCPVCANEKSSRDRMMSRQDFIQKARRIHGDIYSYEKVKYRGGVNEVTIICKQHGEFKQRSATHLSGHGCPKCAFEESSIRYSKGKDVFIEQAISVHGNEYDYSKVSYISAHKKVIIICQKHGPFQQKPHNHLNGKGCPKCKSSLGEKAVRLVLRKMRIVFNEQFRVSHGKRRFLVDFFIPDQSIVIEYHGKQHYKENPFFHSSRISFKKQQERDERLRYACEEKGFRLIEIGYFDFDNIESILRSELSVYENKIIH